jgi:acyl carrier protein
MKRDELMNKIQSALQREDVLSEDTLFSDIKEWDSLSIISVISLFDELFSKSLTYREITELKSIRELIDKVKDRLA